MKLKVIFIAWLIICVTLFASCNRGAKQSTEASAFNGVIKAQVENGDSLNSIISELRAAAGWGENSALSLSGTYAEGGFTVTLPESPDSKFLNSYWGFPEHYNISDRDGNFFVFDTIFGFDNNGSRAATFKLITKESEYELIYVSFYYVDRDVLLDGLNLKKGWNTVSTTESLETGMTYYKTDNPDLTVKWRFERAASAAASSGPYPKILAGDLSEFAGIWVNNRGDKRELRSDGTSGYGQSPLGYSLNKDGYYEWSVSFEEFGGYAVYLLPGGIDVQGDHEINGNWSYGILPTDKTKDRVVIITGDAPSLSAVYYREGEQPAAEKQSKEYIVNFNNKRIPVTVFYSMGDEGNYNLERAVFSYDDNAHTLQLDGMTVWHEALNVSANDYNFDGFMDINMINSFGANSSNKIFLYNEHTRNYKLNDELSLIGSITVDSETHTLILTYHDYDTAATILGEYGWERGEVIYIRELNSDDVRQRINNTQDNNIGVRERR